MGLRILKVETPFGESQRDALPDDDHTIEENIMETPVSTNETLRIAALARLIKPELDERVADYDAVCEHSASQGYRPQYCFHGVYLWTDYDPICGWCEDGDDWRDTEAKSLVAAEKALARYNEGVKTIIEASVAVYALRQNGTITTSQWEDITTTLINAGHLNQTMTLHGFTMKQIDSEVERNMA